MKTIQKYLQISIILTLVFGIQNTVFAQKLTTTTEQERPLWELMNSEEKYEYCRDGGIDRDTNCRAIYNESSNCYYENESQREFDRNNDCKIEGQIELCTLDRATKINTCIEENPGAGRLYCEEQFVCRNSEIAQPRFSESGVPYDSEYFNINDPTGGLIAPNQKTFDTKANGGPIIGTINVVINLLVSLIGIFALLVFIIGAIFLITANGDDNKIQKGKGAIKYALIGIVFVMMSYSIVILIQSILF